MNTATLAKAALCSLYVWTLVASANPAEHAEKAVRTAGRASGNASASAGHSLAATGQLASGVVATPIMASGAVATGAGSAAMQAGGALMDSARRPIGTPLPVTDETISILSPNQALQKATTTGN